jgi:allantoinase
MSSYDLLFRGGTLVTAERLAAADVAVVDGRVVAIGPELESQAAEVVDASGLHLFPGFIDAHVHFNEPGREHWEGLASGSRSLAAGGGTVFFEMPLNAAPPTLDREGFERKRACAEAKSILDFALWGGLTPINLGTMEELADAGAIGFKAFMSRSGTSDFPHSDANVLKQGWCRLCDLGRGARRR